MSNHELVIQELTWSDIREEAGLASPLLREIIDEIDPDASFKLYKAKYPFGAKILDNKEFYLPTNKGSMPLSNKSIPEGLSKDLNYLLCPLGIITDKSIEIYADNEEKIFSLSLSNPAAGLELGIWEYFGWSTPYTVSSGARSLYMVPRISKAESHNKLRKYYDIKLLAPKCLYDHWAIFREIADSSRFEDKWHCSIIFLGRKWHQKLVSKDKKWIRLLNLILTKGWEHSGIGRNKVIMDSAWEIIAQTLTRKGMKPNPYVIDTLKHLIFVALGNISGFAPAINDDAGPVSGIQKAYTEIYGLKEYIPTIMQPKSFDLKSGKSVYYSLQTPTLLSSAPKTRNVTSNIEDIRELKEIMTYFLHQDFSGIWINGQAFNDVIKQVHFNCFHTDTFAQGSGIRPTSEMPNNDQSLLHSSIKDEKRSFADNGSFLRGCIRISS
ncbi:MAG: hypothetical protein Q7V63_07450 [Gammaproteobacteria bacterium]|nr:hypothetical protein [Gammaproteobacteria bacterium]